MLVTKDKFELPIAVADNPYQLSAMIGKSVNTIVSTVSKYERGVYKKCPYRRVVIESDDE